MDKDPLEDEFFGISFANEEKLPMKVILMFHFVLTMTDDTKSQKIKNYIGNMGRIIAEGIEETPPNEELLLPFDGLALVYHSLAAAANIAHTPNVKNGFTGILRLNKMKAEPADVVTFCNEAKQFGQRKLDEIHRKHGQHPDVKELRADSEKTWRNVAKDRLKNKR